MYKNQEELSQLIGFYTMICTQIYIQIQDVHVQISQVFSEYNKYNILNEHKIPIIIQHFGDV